jgi:glycosyltransferase involved in cell wall biosynthesis
MISGRGSILIDARANGQPGAAGLARSVLKLTEHMGPTRDGLALRILVNRSGPQLFPLAEIAAQAELIDTDIKPTAVLRSRELGRLIRDVGASVFYATYPLYAPLFCPCPMVVTIHDCIIESSARNAGGVHRQLGLKAATSAILRQAIAVTAPSQASLAEIRRHYPTAPNPTLVPNGIDAGQFAGVTNQAVTAVREQYNLPERFILTIGAHRPHKNHGMLLQALAAMPSTVSLVIVGGSDPKFRDSLPGQVSRLGLEPRVRLIPSVTEEALPAVYKAASLFAFPSLVEGFGLPVLEAMAAGVPVVASAIPALTEVCGSAAMLLPPHDTGAWAAAMTRVLDDSAAASAMVAAGTAVVAAATWDRGGRALGTLLASATVGAVQRAAGPTYASRSI